MTSDGTNSHLLASADIGSTLYNWFATKDYYQFCTAISVWHDALMHWCKDRVNLGFTFFRCKFSNTNTLAALSFHNWFLKSHIFIKIKNSSALRKSNTFCEDSPTKSGETQINNVVAPRPTRLFSIYPINKGIKCQIFLCIRWLHFKNSKILV